MGKRSRKRGASTGADVSPAGTSRQERDAARRRRAQAAARAQEQGTGARRARRGRPTIDERPEAPWGSFPLVEIAVFLAIVLLVVGLVIGGTDGRILVAGALALGSLAGLELSIREHFAGYRSHTTLLAAAGAFVALVATTFAAGGLAPAVPVAGIVFMGTWWALREAFKRRSGGLGFR